MKSYYVIRSNERYLKIRKNHQGTKHAWVIYATGATVGTLDQMTKIDEELKKNASPHTTYLENIGEAESSWIAKRNYLKKLTK